MIRLDEHFELIVGGSNADREQASLLRAFFRQSIARRCAGGPLLREVNIDAVAARRSAEAVDLALAPLLPRANVIVFDVESLIERAGHAVYALLSPGSVESTLHPTGGSAASRLSRILALESALRSCRLVLVFDPRQARLLATLGARDVHVLPLPAMAPPPAEATPTGGLVVIAHDVPDDAAPSLATMVQVAARDLRITLVQAADRHAVAPPILADAANAIAHIHVGYAREPSPPLRIIDSFAARKPVIHFVQGNRPEIPDDLTRLQMTVEPFRSGFLSHTQSDVVSVLHHLRSDAAMRDIFRRNMDHAVAAFNAAIERRLWDALA